MSQYSFKLPDIGEGVVTAEIVEWHVSPGDFVEQDAPLVDVMTDKATVEIAAPIGGRVVALGGEPGVKLAVGSELVLFEIEGGAEADAAREKDDEPAYTAKAASVPAQRQPSSPSPDLFVMRDEPEVRSRGHRRNEPARLALASPAVRRRAYELGVDLAHVTGSGPAGRISPADLDTFALGRRGHAVVGGAERHGATEIKVIGLRRTIAERMRAAKRHIPHFSYVEEIDVTEVERLRAELNECHASARGKLTFLPFLMTAMAVTLPEWPECNATYDDAAEIVTRHGAVNIGIGTQTPHGLVVPVVRHAEALDLWKCAEKIGTLSAAAREGRLSVDELRGSTITITSLGALGGIATTPVINRPEVAIVGVNRIVERPVVREGRIEVRKMMNLSSSFDHRVVDGFGAANWIQAIKRRLETPAMLFVG